MRKFLSFRPWGCPPPGVNPTVCKILKFGRLIGKIFFNHQGNLEGYGVVELTQIKTRQLSDLFKSVDESVSVNEELT